MFVQVFDLVAKNASILLRSSQTPRVAALILLILSSGCEPDSETAKRPKTTEATGEVAVGLSKQVDGDVALDLSKQDANPLDFDPDSRLFVGRYGTGLDPNGKIEFLGNHVQTLPEIHERYVQEFTLRPGFGMERYHWQPSEWAELIAGDSNVSPNSANGDQVFPSRDSNAEVGNKLKASDQRPKYNSEAETLTFPSYTLNNVVERVWTLREMHLIGLIVHKGPAVYSGEIKRDHPTRHGKPRNEQLPISMSGKSIIRHPDEFEAAALKELQDGNRLKVRTTSNEMRIVGAIRARAECTTCHECAPGSLLGAFTYTLVSKSFATKPKQTKPKQAITDLADLTPREIASIQVIESIGGTIQRDATNSLRPVVSVNMHETMTKDANLRALRPFRGLRALDISDTKITDTGISELVTEHRQLEEIDLSGTKITDEALKELQKLPHLRKLRLWSTKITDAGLSELRGLNELELLALGQSPITDVGLKEIAGLKNLRTLTIFNIRKITDAGITHLEGLTQLEDLNIAGTRVTDNGLKALQNLQQLRSLDLSLTEVTDAGMAYIKCLKRLQTLRLNRIKRAGQGLKDLEELTELRSLELRVNDITDSDLYSLKGLKQLEALDLSNSELSDAGLATLSQFQQLQSLNLWDASITDQGLKELTKLQKLQVLDLGHTQITNAGLDSLKELKDLRWLSVAETRVTDAAAEDFKKVRPDCRIKVSFFQ